MNNLITRQGYLDQILLWKNKNIVKVLAGVRRAGKSSILLMYQNYLKKTIKKPHLLYLNFESLEYEHLKNYADLNQLVKNTFKRNQQAYLLLDEVQRVESWEKAVASFLVDFNKLDITITGSNAQVLNSELTTLLAGRYVQIPVYPLSFNEFLSFRSQSKSKIDVPQEYQYYLKIGGLPALHYLHESKTGDYLSDIVDSIVMKDVIARGEIKDVALLESILEYVSKNIGSTMSANKIANYLTSNGRKTSNETIENYLKMLENAYIIYRSKRYDLKSKLLLKTLGKYYLVDSGIRNAIVGLRETDRGHILENIVYLELLRRGFRVRTGKIDQMEIDFIAEKNEQKTYYQVAESMRDEQTQIRELKPLLCIHDQYPKIVISADQPLGDFVGIKHLNVMTWLQSASNTSESHIF